MARVTEQIAPLPERESILTLLFGRPLSSEEDLKERVGPMAGIPVFGLDALSSAALMTSYSSPPSRRAFFILGESESTITGKMTGITDWLFDNKRPVRVALVCLFIALGNRYEAVYVDRPDGFMRIVSWICVVAGLFFFVISLIHALFRPPFQDWRR